jgi:hypothetical protein
MQAAYNEAMSGRHNEKKFSPAIEPFYYCDECLALMKQPAAFRESGSKTTFKAFYMGKCSACGKYTQVQPRDIPFRSD